MSGRWAICGDTAYGPRSGLWTGSGWSVNTREYPARQYLSVEVAEAAIAAMTCSEMTNPTIIPFPMEDTKR